MTDNRLANATTYSYDDAGNLLSFTYPNGVVHTFTFDVTDRPTNLAVTKGGVTQASYAQTFSDAGRKLTVNENGTRLVNYAYDDIYRLLSETIGADSLVYTLDPVGNRLNRASTIPSLPTVGSTYDNNDRLTADSYDANGNTLASGGNSYGYDFEDRLTSFNGSAVAMIYDGDGNRVVRTGGGVTTRYLVDELTPTGYAQVVEEVQAGAVVRRYMHGVQRISQTQLISGAWTTHYYGYDGGFSVRQLSDAAGAVTDTYTYDAFGNTIASVGIIANDFLYRAERCDPALALYYLRERFLTPKTGRFIRRDRYEGDEEDPPSLNAYSYGVGDPVNLLDPSGFGNIQWRAFVLGSFGAAWGVIQQAGISVRGLASMATFAQKRADYLQTVLFMQRYPGAVVTNGLRTFNGRTIAVAQMINRSTKAVETFVFISKSRYAMHLYDALEPFETPVYGMKDAEQNLVDFAQKNGYDMISIAAGRGICPKCVAAISELEASQGFKIFMGKIRGQ